MATQGWHQDPHRGGRPVPDPVRAATAAAIIDHGRRHFADREIAVRFKAQFCYVDGTLEPVPAPTGAGAAGAETARPESPASDLMPLCRLRFFGPDRWSLTLYSYAHETYDPTVFGTGEFFGPACDGFDLAATLYLSGPEPRHGH